MQYCMESENAMTTFKPTLPEKLMWHFFRKMGGKGRHQFNPEGAKEAAETMMMVIGQNFGTCRVDAGISKGISTPEYDVAKINCAIELCCLVLDPKYDYLFNRNEDDMTYEQALNFLNLNCLVTSQDQKEIKEEAVRTLRRALAAKKEESNDRTD